jgi:hypothetical protein
MAKKGINIVPPKEPIIYDRTTSDILKITEDKLRLKLIDLKKSIENKTSIFCYIGIIATIIVALISSNFKDFLFGKEVWQAIFIVGLVFMGILLIKDVVFWFKNRKDIDDVIKDIKKEQK